MIEEYLQRIDELLSASPAVSEVEIIRRSIRDTELEKVLPYRYRVTLANGGFVEMTERVLEVRGTLVVTIEERDDYYRNATARYGLASGAIPTYDYLLRRL